ncbi:HAD-IA family hydrolase [Patescibacteria group bacterium]|nr:HAD-IA family hydrolase [Patescibacteria group bacterium]
MMFLDVGHTLAWDDLQGKANMAMRELRTPVTQAQLARGDREARRMINRFVKENGHTSTMPASENAPPTSIDAYYATMLMHAGIPGIDPNSDAFRRTIMSWWDHQKTDNWFTVLGPEVVETLRRLTVAGQRLGIISNSEGKVGRLLTGLGIRDAFELVIDSGVEGVAKPDPEIFRLAARRAGVAPEDCLHVGDQPDVDIRGALAVGMSAIHYDPQGTFSDMMLPGSTPCRNLLDIADAVTSTYNLSRLAIRP